jgi:hypothetical protein
LLAAPPDTVGTLDGPKATASGRHTQRCYVELLGDKGLKRQNSGWPGECRQDKPGEIVDDGAGNQLAQRPLVAMVRPSESLQIAVSFTLSDNGRRIAQSDQDQVHQKATCPPISVKEWMNPFEGRMPFRKSLGWWRRIVRDLSDFRDPVGN